jgi:hypothetical protein
MLVSFLPNGGHRHEVAVAFEPLVYLVHNRRTLALTSFILSSSRRRAFSERLATASEAVGVKRAGVR